MEAPGVSQGTRECPEGGSEKLIEEMVEHFVLFTLKDGVTDAQYAELDARLMLLHIDDMEGEYKYLASLYLDHDIAVQDEPLHIVGIDRRRYR